MSPLSEETQSEATTKPGAETPNPLDTPTPIPSSTADAESTGTPTQSTSPEPTSTLEPNATPEPSATPEPGRTDEFAGAQGKLKVRVTTTNPAADSTIAVQTALNAVWGVMTHLGGQSPADNPGPGDMYPRLGPLRLDEGALLVYSPHTTAGVTINENADPDVVSDMVAALERMVPWEAGYAHGEGNAAAHVKASLMGSSARVLVTAGRIRLGTWQGIFLCEFDGPRDREVWVSGA